MNIKVGQIYSHRHAGEKIIICITKIKNNGMIYAIRNNGNIGNRFHSQFYNYELIAEFDSWIEAVNSPEFKGEK